MTSADASDVNFWFGEIVGNITEPDTREWSRPSEWPISWTAVSTRSNAALPSRLPTSQRSAESNWTSPAMREGLTSLGKYDCASVPFGPSIGRNVKSIELGRFGCEVCVNVTAATFDQTLSAAFRTAFT